MPLDLLPWFRRPLVGITGKGGVGKSTVALAAAMVGARDGAKTLLLELGSRAVSSDLLGTSSAPGFEPSQPDADAIPRLWTAHLQAMDCLQDYFYEHLKIRKLVRMATESRVLRRLWDAAPSVNEFSLLHRIARFVDDEEWDRVVVDLPATGHAIALLGVPQGALGIVPMGTMADRAREIDRLLHDRTRTGLAAVSLPEELPVSETIQLFEQLQEQVGLSLDGLVVNRMTRPLMSTKEAVCLRGVETHSLSEPARYLVALGEEHLGLGESEDAHCDHLREVTSLPVCSVFESQSGGRMLLDDVCARLVAAEEEDARRYRQPA